MKTTRIKKGIKKGFVTLMINVPFMKLIAFLIDVDD